ncbi:DUF6934 family protein [Runella zeae]|uniref:DUF6934 family protein n=1 Tax=Runella zeae TaxID=94255 RepID=UPI0023538E43|nr:hypothetical protein [Runella zeae]
MNVPFYSFQTDITHAIYLFESIGVKGFIQKAIVFEATEIDNSYNLSLCDIHPISGKMNFSVISANGDTQKVLATIYHIILHFTDKHPHCRILFFGSSAVRNRLYRMAINHSLSEILAQFEVWGFLNDSWLPFDPNKNFDAFLINRK